MADEQALEPAPPPGFFSRLGGTNQNVLTNFEATIPDASATEKIRRHQQVLDLRTQSRGCLISNYSRLLPCWKITDTPTLSGRALRSYTIRREISLQRFPHSNYSSPSARATALAPDALLRLGRAYQAAGMFDKAIDAFSARSA